jgi:hypothetical protein
MKEIDFLPEWYKSGRRRQFGYRTQYIALSGILLVMVVWHLLNLHSISKAQARIDGNVTATKQAENTSKKLAELQGQISQLYKKQALMLKTDSRLNLANMLAEMSHLINDKIVLSRLEIIPERFAQQDKDNSAVVAGVVRAVKSESVRNQQTFSGNVRFKIVLTGVAADAGDVAALICRLEESSYFSSVTLCYSRNIQIQAQNSSSSGKMSDLSNGEKGGENKTTAISIPVSRFEISCYLANYRQD